MDHHQNQNCHVEPIDKPLDREALVGSDAAYLAVSGLGCPRCATRVNNSLLRLDGVVESRVFLEQSFAAVAYDPIRVSIPDLIQAIADAGNDGRHHYEGRLIAHIPASGTYQQ